MKKEILLILCICLVGSVVSVAQGLESNTDQKSKKDTDRRTVELFKKLTTGAHHQFSRLKAADSPLLERVEFQAWQDPDFIPTIRFDYDYENQQRVEAVTSTSTVEDPPEWVPNERIHYSYENNLLVENIDQIYDGNEYVNEFRSLYNYQQVNETMFIDTEIFQVWDAGTEDWVNATTASFIAENGEIVRLEEGAWDGEEWILEDRILIIQEDNNLITISQELIDEEWENVYREIFPDLTFGELYEIFIELSVDHVFTGSVMALLTMFPDFTEQFWDEDANEWVDEFRQVSVEIFENGDLSERIVSEQESIEDEWITFNEVRVQYEDTRPVVYTLYEQEFVGDAEELVPTSRENHIYEQNLLTEIIQEELFMEDDQIEEELSGRVILSYDIGTSIEPDTQPITFKLGSAYPNPFNPTTVVPFQAGNAAHFTIQVYDMLGRHVATLVDGNYPAGHHQVNFDASGLSSGVYMIVMQTSGHHQVQRVTLVK